jgi:hypothetical protein
MMAWRQRKNMPDQRNPTENFEASFLHSVREDDGSAAEAILVAGRPIHIRRTDTPTAHVIRIHPGGREELIHVDLSCSSQLNRRGR